jgi:hypothetical protein
MGIPGLAPEHIDDVVGRTLRVRGKRTIGVTTWIPSSADAASTASSVTSPSVAMWAPTT